MGKTKPLNLLNTAVWLILTCLRLCPFCLRLGDRALAPNKQEGKQKVVSIGDKCWFGSNVHKFIVLKHERHTSKQDLCMDM